MNKQDDYIPVNINVLGEVTNLINSTLDLPNLLEVIMGAAKEILNSESSSLLLLDKEKQVLNFYVVSGEKKELIKGITIPIGTGIAGIVAQNEEALIVNDAENDPRIFKEVDVKIEQITKNLICVPMKVKSDLVGVLEVINSKNRLQYTEGELSVLSYLADQAAIAIHNSDLFRQLARTRYSLQNRIKELSILYLFNDLAHFSVSVDDFLFLSLNFICQNFDVNSALLYIKNTINQEFMLSQSKDNYQSNFPVRLPAKEAELFFNNTPKLLLIKKSIPEDLMIINELNIEPPLLVVPLFTEGILIGLIITWNPKEQNIYSASHIRLMENISIHLSQSYSNLKLQEELNKQNKIKQELKIAHLLQEKILPFTFQTPKGITIQGISIPAEEVGGDFYDFIPIDKGKFALVIADVSGKGIPAALFMALARNTIRAEAHIDPNPKKVITTSNELLVSDSESGMFVTGAYFLVDSFNQSITYVSAGHNNQLLYRSKTKDVEIVKGFGKPLGVMENTKYEEKVLFYDKDDILVLFSDGIIEAEKINGEQYEELRLIDFVKRNYNLPLPDLISALKDEVLEFTEGNPFTDDFTLLIAGL